MAAPTQQNNMYIKYVCLVTLTVQNAALALSMRYARTRPGDLFLSSAAVLMAEVVKLVSSLLLVYKDERTITRWSASLYNTIVLQPMDTLKVCVPAALYIIQNNLLYVSASHLDAATYQVTYQLKIITTAIFAVIILRRSLNHMQWSAIFILLVGVIMVTLAQTEKENDGGEQSAPSDRPEQNRLKGLTAALLACVLSGLGGIYFEKILKGSDVSVWMRNVQLSLLSLPFGLFTCYTKDYQAVQENGLFFGFDWFVWYVVLLQAGGGLIVAMVVKYADNILKGFATSLAIVISCIVSIYLFDFYLTFQFAFGATLVICSIFMYGHKVSPKSSDKNGQLLPSNKV